MTSIKMSIINDDGLPLDLITVFTFFLMPNLIFIILICFNLYLVYVSKKHHRLNRSLGKLANFFAKGALDRIIRNMLRHFEKQKRQQEQQPQHNFTSKNSSTSTSNSSIYEKKYDANYLLLIPFQIDLLLTVFVYKILTRDVYPETCQSFLTTYANREKQVVCWLKNINKNTSNLSFNISLQQYCTNQSITYINFEHNDVICVQYVFKLLNIIDTVTNIFAWHQAIVFIVTKSIVFSYWYQQKLRTTSFWSNLITRYRHIILFIVISFISSIYVVVFVFIIPIHFISTGRRRIDLTGHILYACSKFLIAIIIHVNLYTLYQWHSHNIQKNQLIKLHKGNKIECHQVLESVVSIQNSEYGSPPSTMLMDDYLGTISTNYLTPNVSI